MSKKANRLLRERIATNVERRRAKLGLSRAQLADLVEVDRMTVYRWELMQRSPDLDAIQRLASALKCDVSTLCR